MWPQLGGEGPLYLTAHQSHLELVSLPRRVPPRNQGLRNPEGLGLASKASSGDLSPGNDEKDGGKGA